jgi:hypothetical protein
LRRGFREALRLFDCPLIVKIDPDALIIGPGLDRELTAAFAAQPRCGLLGTYRIDWNGETRDLSYWRDRMSRRRADLGKPLGLALANGYVLGEGMQGGCYALHRRCLDRIDQAGWLTGMDGYRPSVVRGEHVAEDSLIALLTYAAGYTAAEFGGPGQPFGIWDVGLPMPPDELVRQHRIVTHALKYRDADSIAARDYFRQRRHASRQIEPAPL